MSNAKPHRNNSDFQLRYFLAGDCKTPDGAWILLYGQKIDMEMKLEACVVQEKRRTAMKLKYQEILDRTDISPSERMLAECDLQEQDVGLKTWEMNYTAAKNELATIESLMAELEPLRKYGHLGVLEASEACQQEEWLLTLKTRAENYLVAQGAIPHDELRFMRNHPEFEQSLVPYIQNVHTKLTGINKISEGLNLLSKPLMAIDQVPQLDVSTTQLKLEV